MSVLEKIHPDLAACWLALVLVFMIFGFYGRQAMEWLLVKLHEFFIEGNTG